MNILLTGASGFIGRSLARELRSRRHRVVAAVRDPRGNPDAVATDFTRDLQVDDWVPRLSGIDAVVNAVGIIRERGDQTFDRIHSRAPQALFAACAQAGVQRVVQISALGADHGSTRYFTSKHAADEVLESLDLQWTIVQPSLVYGQRGASAALFQQLASMPMIFVPGRGDQLVQPIHIDDLVAAVVELLEQSQFIRERVALVGPRAQPLREFLATLRAGMGLRPARVMRIPAGFMSFAAGVGRFIPSSPLDPETLTMLNAGNHASAHDTTSLLGRPPRPSSEFIAADARPEIARAARLLWLLSLLRVSIAAVWIWTAIVTVFLFPHSESYALLERTGVPGAWAPLMMYGAAGLDLIFGIATLAMRRRRWLWIAQMALIIGYTLIITVQLPEFWLHPYGPLLKNLPMLAAIYTLYLLEET